MVGPARFRTLVRVRLHRDPHIIILTRPWEGPLEGDTTLIDRAVSFPGWVRMDIHAWSSQSVEGLAPGREMLIKLGPNA